jgi:hypothetical protein
MAARWYIKLSVESEYTVPQQFHRSISSNVTPISLKEAMVLSSKFFAFVFSVHPG